MLLGSVLFPHWKLSPVNIFSPISNPMTIYWAFLCLYYIVREPWMIFFPLAFYYENFQPWSKIKRILQIATGLYNFISKHIYSLISSNYFIVPLKFFNIHFRNHRRFLSRGLIRLKLHIMQMSPMKTWMWWLVLGVGPGDCALLTAFVLSSLIFRRIIHWLMWWEGQRVYIRWMGEFSMVLI